MAVPGPARAGREQTWRMRSRPAVLACSAALALSGALAGCSTATPAGGPAATPAARPGTPQPAPTGSPAAVSATDWITYHRDAARTGAAPASPAAGPLSIAWRRHLDGAVYGQPLVVGGLVIAATEGDTVYGLDRATGRVRWHVQLGTPVPLSALPCGDIDPLGITGTPVYDPATRLVYAVAETTGFRHVLAGIAVPSGKLVFSRDVPTPDGQPRYDQQRAALALDQGRIYVAFGGLDGDCGPYQGSINGVPASGQGPVVSYKVPTVREAGMWAAGRPGRRPGRHHLRQQRQRGGHRTAVRRQRLGHRAHPRAAAHRHLRPLDLGRRTTRATATSVPPPPACWATGQSWPSARAAPDTC